MSESGVLPAITHTACPYCGVGCGVVASVDNGVVSISGDQNHPANHGKLCSKGLALGSTFNDPARLLKPAVNGRPTSWTEATTLIADTFQNTIEQHGRDAIAFYVSGQLLTEDYYVVNKFVKGWLGTANIDTNSRLCMASSVVGHKRAFGSDTVPGCYEDLDTAELIVLVGSNLAWCHPVVYQRIIANKERNPQVKIVVIDPRRSITADNADLHLAIKPDGDTLLFNALLEHLSAHGKLDNDYIDKHVAGLEDALEHACESVDEHVADKLGLADAELQLFLRYFANTQKTVTIYSQGVNQSRSGTDKVNAILNCHLATGRIGKPGMGPLSITGQPNAMGGREVGGLSTMLACHRELDNEVHQSQAQRFWQSPYIATQKGLTAVEMFDAVQQGSIKAIWIMGTNPVDSMPDANQIADALKGCPFVVVSDVTAGSDTVAFADVVLPAQAFGEKDGTVTNSERRISRQRRFMEPAGEAMPDWWAVSSVARNMGFVEAFNYATPAQIFTEYAQMSAFENDGSIDFDIGFCASLTTSEYDTLLPFQWPKPENSLAGKVQTVRFFAKGQFYTPDRRARMVSITPAVPGNQQLTDEHPLVLNTGRIRDQWHTMTRTGLIPRLMSHQSEPFVEINPSDALIHGIADADIVCINSPLSTILARAMLSDRQSIGQVYVPMHWSDQFASKARVDTLIEPSTDPYSRQPASKNQAVSIQRFAGNSYAYLLTRAALILDDVTDIEYWAKSPVEGGWQYEMASTLQTMQLKTVVEQMYQLQMATQGSIEGLDRIDYQDQSRHRTALLDSAGCVYAFLYIDAKPVELSRSWALDQFDLTFANPAKRWHLMAGRAASDQPEKGAIVCSCYSVGDKQIARAVKSDECRSVDAIGRVLGAGTNCGSCRNEIGILVKKHAVCNTATNLDV